MTIRTTLFAVGVAAGITIGLGATPARVIASTAAPATTATASLASVRTPLESQVRPPVPAQAPPAGIGSTPVESRGIGSVIVKALKQVPGLFGTIGKAIKKGYASFAAAWRKVPAWIRILAGDLSAAAIYDLLKGFF